jgi:hypothetical protein
MDELQKLYNVLSRDGLYTKSFEEFKVQFQDEEYQSKVFGVVTRDGLYTKDMDSFVNKYAVKKKDSFEVTSEGQPQEQPI